MSKNKQVIKDDLICWVCSEPFKNMSDGHYSCKTSAKESKKVRNEIINGDYADHGDL
jgi:hypothetical protein